MTNEEFQKLVLEKLINLENNMASKADIERIEKKLDTVYEQVAGLTEFKTETAKTLQRHELDIQILKKVIAS